MKPITSKNFTEYLAMRTAFAQNRKEWKIAFVLRFEVNPVDDAVTCACVFFQHPAARK